MGYVYVHKFKKKIKKKSSFRVIVVVVLVRGIIGIASRNINAQCIDQGMPAQCMGRQVSPRVESCVRWQDSTLFKEIIEHAAANGGGTRSGRPTARSLF